MSDDKVITEELLLKLTGGKYLPDYLHDKTGIDKAAINNALAVIKVIGDSFYILFFLVALGDLAMLAAINQNGRICADYLNMQMLSTSYVVVPYNGSNGSYVSHPVLQTLEDTPQNVAILLGNNASKARVLCAFILENSTTQ